MHPLEIEIKLQHASIKRAPKSPPMRILPFPIHDPERQILVRRTGGEEQENGIGVAGLFDDLVGWRGGLVDQVWVEDVELRRGRARSGASVLWMVRERR